MKASVSFYELQDILCNKTKQSVSLSFVDDRTLHIVYPFSVGFMKKDIHADMIIKGLIGDDLLVQISAGKGTDKLITTVLNKLRGKIPPDLLEQRFDNHLVLHLGQIEQAKAVLDKINVTTVRVLSNSIEVEGTLRA